MDAKKVKGKCPLVILKICTGDYSSMAKALAKQAQSQEYNPQDKKKKKWDFSNFCLHIVSYIIYFLC